MYRWEVLHHIARSKVIGIVRTGDAASAVQAGQALLNAGLTTVEVALTNPGGLTALATLTAANPEAVLGAGTVTTPAAADAAARAGARFLLAPGYNREVMRTGHSLGLAFIPGAATVSEIDAALTEGADAVKLFPVSDRRPQWMADVLAALPHAPLVPTGGVGLHDAAAWVAAGAVACGVGSALTRGGPLQLPDRVAALHDSLLVPTTKGSK